MVPVGSTLLNEPNLQPKDRTNLFQRLDRWVALASFNLTQSLGADQHARQTPGFSPGKDSAGGEADGCVSLEVPGMTG